MSRRKTVRKAEFDAMSNCLTENKTWKGRWQEFYGNANPLVLELGCGKGRLSMGQAVLFPYKNFLGIDVKSPRMWVSARVALKENIKNIAFLRCHIETITDYFDPGEVDEIWITFPDPFPRSRQAKLRLTGRAFLARYLNILKPGGLIHFKTDNVGLFDWTLELFEELNKEDGMKVNVVGLTRDLHHSDLLNEANGVVTDFEERFLAEGKETQYVVFGVEG
jgi:tRNA (guanine-N7-)-methyltransferase